MKYSECLRKYRILSTLMKMFYARRYCVHPSLPVTLEEFVRFRSCGGKPINEIVVKKNEQNERLKVFFPRCLKTGVRHIREIVKQAEAEGIHHIVLVLRRKLTPFANNRLGEYSGVKIEKFNAIDLVRDITQHSMVPKHRLLSQSDTKELLKRLGLRSVSLLNGILKTDPVSAYFDAQIGQVFEIERTSPEGHQYTSYRTVTKPPK